MKRPPTRFVIAWLSMLGATALAFGASEPVHVFIQVEGLACPFCAKGLEKHLNKLDAVANLSISLKEGEAVLQLKPGREVGEKELREAVRKAGFTAGTIRFGKGPTKEKPQENDGREKS